MDPELDDEGRNDDGEGGDGVVCESGGMGWWEVRKWERGVWVELERVTE